MILPEFFLFLHRLKKDYTCSKMASLNGTLDVILTVSLSENGDDGILLYVMFMFSFINHLCCNLSLNGGSDRYDTIRYEMLF